MLDTNTTKIIELLIHSEYDTAKNELLTFDKKHVFFPILNYLTQLHFDTKNAVQYWSTVSKSDLDTIFVQTFDAYNLYLSNNSSELTSFLFARIKQPIHNFVEASNLSFYAHTLHLDEQRHLLSKAKELTVPSELLIPEKQEGGFTLYHPMTLLKVHYQVIQFLSSNFENEQELELFLRKIRDGKPM